MKQIALWLLLIGSLTGCRSTLTTPANNEYFCPPELAYRMDGEEDPTQYRVDRACYKSMTLKQKACYTEVRP